MRPAYVQAFLSRIRRLNLIFAGLGLLLLVLSLSLQSLSWQMFLFMVWLPDVSLSVWMHRLVASRRLQEKRLNLIFIQIFLRVMLLVTIPQGLTGGIPLTAGDVPPFLSLEGLASTIGIFGMFAAVVFVIHKLYRLTFHGIFEPYRYTNSDISSRLIQQWGTDSSTLAFNQAAYRFLSLDNIFNSKLVGWLPAYPVEWGFRIRFHKRDGHYLRLETTPTSSLSSDVTILYDRRDQRLADFLAREMRTLYDVRMEQLTTRVNGSFNSASTCIPVITPYSVRAANAFCQQYTQVHCIPVLMQKTSLPQPLNQIQYVDARSDYRRAPDSIHNILVGGQANTVTGEVDDRRRFFVPRSQLVLFIPSFLLLFLVLAVLIVDLIYLFSPETFAGLEQSSSFFVGLTALALLVAVIPLLILFNGVRRKYSLSTIATVNIVTMLPFIPVLFSSFNDPNMLCGLPVLGGLFVVPPLLSALLAWTKVDFREWFGHEPASPRVWAPQKGLSWGVLGYIALLVIGVVVLFAANQG